MPTSTVNKETAREILEIISEKYNGKKFDYSDSWILEAMREIASLTWDACKERTNQEALFVIDNQEITAPDKETYLTNLFKE